MVTGEPGVSLVVAVRHVGQEHRGEHVSVTTRHQLMGEGVVLVLAILHQHVTLKHVLVGIYLVLKLDILFYLEKCSYHKRIHGVRLNM